MVELLSHSKLSIAAKAIRTCWASHKKGGCYNTPTDTLEQSDINLIKRVALKFKHASTIEHLVYNFYLSGISRALLQEQTRHRMANLSVKSTRYTLKELKNEESFTYYTDMNVQEYNENGRERAEKYLVMTSNEKVNRMSILALDNLRDLLNEGISNDLVKYALPESYKTELTWTINARSLQNFLKLRTDKAALWEIRDLANEIFSTLPEEHKFLFKDCVYTEEAPYISGFEVH